MTPELQSDISLIRRLIAIYTDHPVKIETRTNPAQVRWTIQSCAADQSRIVGKRGCHFYSLQMLIADLGDNRTIPYVLNRFPEPEPNGPISRRREQSSGACDMSMLVELLKEILEQLGLGQFLISASKMTEIEIAPRDIEDYNRLTIAKPNPHTSLTTVGALGTLFRAHAEREGMQISLEVLKP